MKKRRHDDRLTHWASHRMAMISSKAPVCQALKVKTKPAIERSSQRVAEWFCDAVLDHPKANLLVDRQSQLTTPNGPSQHIFGLKTKITDLLVYGYWVIMGSARESES
ncbi:hypothetical protein H5410_021489 [Solanum commersonii]|uniref:Uncharacterized protein n=1 Tax=Solanum commersonii TaxID=4109 RepID=A0A9J5ZEE5_SOLCO|nr:hypothetical protein H5410_021489 [Solanum commersonii]